MPNYDIAASMTLSAAEAIWGVPLAAGDRVYIYNGATLTVDVSRSLLQFLLGESSAGDPGAGLRVGHLSFDPAITTPFDGNAVNTNSGVKSSPAATDNPGTKTNTLTIGAGCVFTNSVGGYNVNNKWCFNMAWGQIAANVAFTMKYCGGNNETWLLLQAASQSAAAAHVVGNLTIFVGGVGSSAINPFTLPTGLDIPFAAGFVTADCTGLTANQTFETFFAGRIGTVECSIKGFRTVNMPAGRACTFRFNAITQTAGNFATSAIRVDDNFTQYTEVQPADFTLTNLQDGRVKATVSNIASIALTDTIIVFNAAGNRLTSLRRFEYVAASGRKPANCLVLPGLALAANNGLYAMFSTDNFVYGLPSAAANVTPTFVPAVADVRAGTGYGQDATEFTGTMAAGGGSRRRELGRRFRKG